MVLEENGPPQGAANAAGKPIEIAPAADGFDDHEKLVATVPHDEITRTDAVGKPLRDDPQHAITGDVAARVVHLLEAVEVDKQ